MASVRATEAFFLGAQTQNQTTSCGSQRLASFNLPS